MATLTLQKTVGRNQIHRIHGFPHLGTVPKTCVSNVPEMVRGHQDLSDLAGSGTTSTFRVSGTCRPGSAACTQVHSSWPLSPWLLLKAQCVNGINKQQVESLFPKRKGEEVWT